MNTSYRIRSILVQDNVYFLIEEREDAACSWQLLNSWAVQEGAEFLTFEAAEKHLRWFIAASAAVQTPTIYYDHKGLQI